MAQFYFLSILMNILAGLILMFRKNEQSETPEFSLDSGADDFSDFESDFSDFSENPPAQEEQKLESTNFGIFNNAVFRLVVGVLSIFVGIMKLLSVFRNDVPVVGDLIPSLAGVCGGIALLLDYFISNASETLSFPPIIEKVFVDSKKYIGIICIVAGILHFIFPQVLFL